MTLPHFFPFSLPGDEIVFEPANTSASGGLADGSLAAFSDFGNVEALILSQYLQSPKLISWVKAYTDRAREIDNGNVTIYEHVLSLDGQGKDLDLIGKIVRELRGGRDDAPYARALRVRILVNRSVGRIYQLAQIVRLFEDLDTDPGAIVSISEAQPMTLFVRVIGESVNPIRDLHNRLQKAKAGGVRLYTIETPNGVPRARQFRLGLSANYPEANTTEGLNFVGDPTTGGTLAEVMVN